MIILKNKKISTVALVLALTIGATSIALPVVHAADYTIANVVFVAPEPNPVGVGQIVYINQWVEPYPPSSAFRYDNETLEITHPDGTVETLGPVEGWGSGGNVVWKFIPAVTGTYYVQAFCPQQPVMEWGGDNYTYLGGESRKVELIVQQEQVLPLQDVPMPTEYWRYPINAQNRLWADTESGPWLMVDYNYSIGKYNPYTTGPATAHVLWKEQTGIGGLEGGEFGRTAYATGYMYENARYPARLIINGYLFGHTIQGDREISGQTPYCCWDLATGELVWSKMISADYGQIFEYNSVNQVGLHAYLWDDQGSTLVMYDAFTGNKIGQFVGERSGGRNVYDPIGSFGGCGKGGILTYYINTRQGWLAMWNQTKAFDANGLITYQSSAIRDRLGVYGGSWRPRDSVGDWNWSLGWEWNVSIPIIPDGPTSFNAISAPFGVGVIAQTVVTNKKSLFGYDLGKGVTDRFLWGPVNFTAGSVSQYEMAGGVYTRFSPDEGVYYAWDQYTGQLKWKSDEGEYPWGWYGDIGTAMGMGMMFAAQYDALHAYNLTTGKEVWRFYPGDAGYETPYGTWVPRFSSTRACNGKVYMITGVWRPEPMMQRGDRMFCVDAYTGKNIWNITGFWAKGPLANGYLVSYNGYDRAMYVFSKGPSATTVLAPQTVVTNGTAALIHGTVTDQSPASKGTPAISDQWMSAWMDYLHMQQVKPLGATGVPVELRAYHVDNGNMIDIATVDCDINGHYEYLWTPPTIGTYKILATFPGSDAYWTSSAETALGVIEAPPAPQPEPEPEEAPAYTSIDLAVIAAVVVVAILVVYDIISVRRLRK